MNIQNKFKKANVTYKITKDYDLEGGTLIIPVGCTLDFLGGSFKNGTVNLNGTSLIGKINFNTSLVGTTDNSIIYSDYINKAQYNVNTTKVLNELATVAANSGAELVLKAGTYIISSYINDNAECIILKNNINIRGEGIDNTIIKVNPSLYPNRYIKVFSADTISNACIQDLTLDCNGRNNPNGENLKDIYTYIFLFNADYAYNINIRNCKVYDNPGRQCVRIGKNEAHSCKNITIKNCVFTVLGNDSKGGKNQTDHSAVYINADNVNVFNNTFLNNNILSSSSTYNVCSAIEIHSDNVLCKDNYVENFKSAVNVVATVANHINAIYDSNIFKRVTVGFDIWTLQGNTMKNVIIRNNIIQKTNTNNAPIYFRNATTTFDPIIIDNNDISLLDDPLTDDRNYLPIISSPVNSTSDINFTILNNNFHDYPSGIIKINDSIDIERNHTIIFKGNIINNCGRSNGGSEYASFALSFYNTNGNTLIFADNIFINNVSRYSAIKLYNSFFSNISICDNIKLLGNFQNITINSSKNILADNLLYKGNTAKLEDIEKLAANNLTAITIKGPMIVTKVGNGSYPASINTVTFNSAPPTEGTWERGSIVVDRFNNNQYGCLGWVCTNRGTPGTWKSFGRIEQSRINVGITNDRPILDNDSKGFQYYDTTLNKYVCWDGTDWTNLDGTPLT